MPLQLVLGPANCGKIALLFDRFLEAADAGADPFLIVPNRPDVEAVERELVSRRGVLVGGRVGTFDDLFEEVLGRCREARPLVGDVQRRLLLADVVSGTPLHALAPSVRSPTSCRPRWRSRARPPTRPGPRSSRRSSPPTAPPSTGSACTTGPAAAPSPPVSWRAAWAPGTTGRCSPTGSRT